MRGREVDTVQRGVDLLIDDLAASAHRYLTTHLHAAHTVWRDLS